MNLTNKHGLPAPVVRALSFDNYSKGDADFSVTELLDSPRIRALQRLHADDITQDVTDNFFSLLGRACHQILEWGAVGSNSCTAEERLFMTVDVDGIDIVVSGSMDLQSHDDGATDISDYKVTSVLSATADKPSWEQQLNLYAELVRQTKHANIGSLSIIVFLRDWRKSVAERDRHYPQSPILVLSIPLWPQKRAAQFLRERIRLHLEANSAIMAEADPAPCTSEERWEGDPVFAVTKRGAKRASKLFDTKAEAEAYANEAKGEFDVERRGSEPRRCAGNWCRVAEFCDFGRQFVTTQEQEEEEFC